MLLGSVVALRAQDETATNRVVSSPDSVQVALAQPNLETVVSNGATDHSEPGRSPIGNAVLLVTTPAPTPTPALASTLLRTDPPTVARIALESPPTPELERETGDVSVTIIGDSIVLATATDLRALVPNLDFFAQVGLQVPGGIAELQNRAEAGRLGRTVVIDLGSNGTFTSSQFDRIMTLVGADRRIFFVNVNIPHAWRDTNNQLLAEKVAQYSNASLLDWYGASLGHPEYFAADRVHLEPEGAKVLTSLLLGALG